MNYGIWLSFNNQAEGFQIPVNPGSIEIGDGSKGTTYDVAGLGEINVIKNPKLSEYSFSSIFPSLSSRRAFVSGITVDPLVQADLQYAPEDYINYLTKWMGTKRPIRFVFTGDSFDINVAASIESFEWKEVAGSGGDVEYTLKMKKYVFYSAQKVKVEKATATKPATIKKVAAARANDRQTPGTYKLRSGDTLWKIAKSQLGNGDRWKEIQKVNGLTDAQLKSLPVGKVLKLPGGTGGNHA
ncbi:LysM peptidoglycan-binding domain-containing protein [Cohnella nanjingensis]|uniref:LysM peptidoglycan-binding domain-containing protein n=1 Tax=Cohnella nanjingensis TaxID=1387779 RepID=A0A7X0VF62_9BACL|nr:LysM peptidoglycan-binding domain-containing protein [Cohnella nanjingensis]MBB6670284.1 LysM peptidoglycan-binding domain-containing protein [Cohnella nanjingensis]